MPKGRPREFNKEQALEAALVLFWRHGYEGTSLSALTKAMGINVPSLYAAFGNKEELFKQVIDRYIQRPASYLPNSMKQPTARAVVEHLFAGAINMVMDRDHPDGCLLVQGALATGPMGESITKELSRRRAGAEAALRRRFEVAVQQHDLPSSVDPEQLARYIIAVLWGMSVQAAGGATRDQLRQIAKVALDAWPGGSQPKSRVTGKRVSRPKGE